MTIHEKIALITSLIAETTNVVWGGLSHQEEFNKLDLETASKLLLELVLFLLHFCDRQIFCLIGPEKRKILMDGVLWPCRGVAEHAYCPRLFYYMTVEGVFLPSADTEQGAGVHRRVDRLWRPL